MQKYQILGKKGEGAFSEVLKAQHIVTKQFVAIKCMKKEFPSKEHVTKLREIHAIRRLAPNRHIVELIEILYNRSTKRLALVFELMDMNLYELIRSRKHLFSEEKLMVFMYQILKGLDHAHRSGLFHRDIKPENILLNSDGLVKIADFGSCKGLYSKQPLTEYISTRWYRAPECLLTDGYYGYKMDLWSAGCVFFELAALYPLFPGSNEIDQLDKIHDVLGTPPRDVLEKLAIHSSYIEMDFPYKEGIGLGKLVPHLSDDALDLMSQLLEYDNDKRCSTKEALRHPFFKRIKDNYRVDELKSAKSLDEQCGPQQSAVESTSGIEPMDSKSEKLPKIEMQSFNHTALEDGISQTESRQNHSLRDCNVGVQLSSQKLSLPML